MPPREGPADSHVTLKIPRPLYEQLKQVIKGSGFHSVTEFAVYVLRDLVSHHGAQISALRPHDVQQVEAEAAEDSPEVEPLTPEEIEAIRRRLESLGYL
jgi:Arc/MetJ-type ribon-helix-helix transcriptional regulator